VCGFRWELFVIATVPDALFQINGTFALQHGLSSSSPAHTVLISLRPSAALNAIFSNMTVFIGDKSFTPMVSSTGLVVWNISRLLVNETLTLTYSFSVDQAVFANTPISFNVNVSYRSSSPSSLVNASRVRTVHFLTLSRQYVAASPSIDSALLNTSLPETIGANLAIGEVVRASTTVTVPMTTTRLVASIAASDQFVFLDWQFARGPAVICTVSNPQLNASAGWLVLDLGTCKGGPLTTVVQGNVTLLPASVRHVVLTYSFRSLDSPNNVEGAVLPIPQRLLVSNGNNSVTTVTSISNYVTREPIIFAAPASSSIREVLPNERMNLTVPFVMNSSFLSAYNVSARVTFSHRLVVSLPLLTYNTLSHPFNYTPASGPTSSAVLTFARTLFEQTSATMFAATRVAADAQMDEMIISNVSYSFFGAPPGTVGRRFYTRTMTFPVLKVAFLQLFATVTNTSVESTSGLTFVAGETFSVLMNVTVGGFHNLSISVSAPNTQFVSAALVSTGSNLASATGWSLNSSTNGFNMHTVSFGVVESISKSLVNSSANMVAVLVTLQALSPARAAVPEEAAPEFEFPLTALATYGTLRFINEQSYRVLSPDFTLTTATNHSFSVPLQAGDVLSLNITARPGSQLSGSSNASLSTAFGVSLVVRTQFVSITQLSSLTTSLSHAGGSPAGSPFITPGASFSSNSTHTTVFLGAIAPNSLVTVQCSLALLLSVPLDSLINNSVMLFFSSLAANNDPRFAFTTTSSFSFISRPPILTLAAPLAQVSLGTNINVSFTLGLPRGTYSNLTISSLLSPGLQWNGSSLALSRTGFNATTHQATVSNNSSSTTVWASPAINSTIVSVSLGSFVVSSADFVVVVSCMIAPLNSTSLARASALSLNSSLVLNQVRSLSASNRTLTWTLVEPTLSSALELSDSITAGLQVVNATVDVTHTDNSDGHAHGLIVALALGSMTFLGPSVSVTVMSSATNVSSTVSYSPALFTSQYAFPHAQLSVGNRLVVSFSIVVNSTVALNMDLSPRVSVTYFSSSAVGNARRLYTTFCNASFMVDSLSTTFELANSTYPRPAPLAVTLGEVAPMQTVMRIPNSVTPVVNTSLMLFNPLRASLRQVRLVIDGNILFTSLSVRCVSFNTTGLGALLASVSSPPPTLENLSSTSTTMTWNGSTPLSLPQACHTVSLGFFSLRSLNPSRAFSLLTVVTDVLVFGAPTNANGAL
jgi:hypothetical protein